MAEELHRLRALYVNNIDNNCNANGNNNLNNNGRFLRITPAPAHLTQLTLFEKLTSYQNLCVAFSKAKKGKTTRQDIIDFEKDLENNILQLQADLRFLSYSPRPLKTFIIRDPKTRIISKSNFRDRVVHHALCNIIEPIFERTFIFDSYANRRGKGTLAAIKRFEQFQKKATKNNSLNCFVLKADIRHYFQTVNHKILIKIIQREITDPKIIWLIKTILNNHHSEKQGRGMPLGNLTSQFFANVYLNELDQFVKHELKAKFYIRYVDDFVIMHKSREQLELFKDEIDWFLKEKLALELHPDKSKVINFREGTAFLGFRIFPHHKLLQKRNLRRFKAKMRTMCLEYDENVISYDAIYDFLEGWIAYSKYTDSYKLRTRLQRKLSDKFQDETSTKDMNRYLKINQNRL